MGHSRLDGNLGEERRASLFGQSSAAAFAEQLMLAAFRVDKPAHVFDHACDTEIPTASHVCDPDRNLLGRQRGCRDNEHLCAGEQPS